MNDNAMAAVAEVDVRRGAALRQIWISVADYAINIALLAVFAALGVIAPSVPLVILVYALCANGVYLGLIYSGYSRRFRDPFLTRLGVAFGVGANLLAMSIAPQIAFLFVINLFVPLAFAALRFTRTEFLASGVLLSVALGVLFGTGVTEVPHAPHFGLVESMVAWLVITIAIARFLVIQTEIARLGNKLREKNEALHAATKRLAEQASHDDLTGLTNRREFMRLLQMEMARAARSGSAFCVVLLDIDHFKHVNDRLGHAVGDKVLATVAAIYRDAVREFDVCARYGGEEFTILVLNPALDPVIAMIERLRRNVECHPWDAIDPALRVTVSAGVARWREGDTQTELLRRADDAMYEAKAAGRNCVRVSD